MLIPLEFIAHLLSAEGKAKIGEGGRLKICNKKLLIVNYILKRGGAIENGPKKWLLNIT